MTKEGQTEWGIDLWNPHAKNLSWGNHQVKWTQLDVGILEDSTLTMVDQGH